MTDVMVIRMTAVNVTGQGQGISGYCAANPIGILNAGVTGLP